MSTETKNKIVPKLRFPEFNNNDWNVRRLEEVISDFMVPMRDKPKDLTGSVPWCRIEDFDGMYLSKSKSNQGVSLATIKSMNLKVYPIGTLLVSCSADLGRCAITSAELVTNQTFIGLVPIRDEANTVFLYYLMINSQNRLNAKSSGTTISYLSREKFEKFDIIIPIPKEQQKIADCLSSLDELITAHNQKLEALQAHKKGLIQQLFPAEGETMPKRRFEEYRDSGKWVEKKMNEMIPLNEKYGIVDGPFGSNLKTIHYKTEGIPIINSGFVTEGRFFADKYLFVTKEKFEQEKRSAVKAGDIVMAKIGARCGASAILPENHEQGILSGNAMKITIDETKFSTHFIWQQLWQLYLSKKLNVLVMAGAQPAISMANFKEFKLLVPPTKKEQQKIADCLSSLDELITAQTEKIEELQKHKKGLMQGLFPNVNEVNK